MVLNCMLGDTVLADIIGHRAVNGATIPEGSNVSLSSNDTSVATVPDTVAVPPGGAPSLTDIPVTILAVGSADIHVSVTTPDGTIFEDTASIVVGQPVPGLVRVELVLRTLAQSRHHH